MTFGRGPDNKGSFLKCILKNGLRFITNQLAVSFKPFDNPIHLDGVLHQNMFEANTVLISF